MTRQDLCATRITGGNVDNKVEKPETSVVVTELEYSLKVESIEHGGY